MSTLAKWRGAIALVRDAVEHGSRAIEKIQIETAKRPFTVLEHIPAIDAPARAVHVVHDVYVTSVHGVLRAITAVVTTTAEAVLEEIETHAK